jgi:threonine/homoserine/homoserine lactone efflux protein
LRQISSSPVFKQQETKTTLALEQIFSLAFTAFMIGFSGALVPGPVFVAVVSQATKKGLIAGPMAVAGHATLETVTAILLWFGLGIFLESSRIRSVIGILGGGFLIWSGFQLLRFARRASIQDSVQQANAAIVRHNPIVVGLVTSAINPYYYLWWATVGNDLMFRGFEIAGFIGIVVFLVSHWMSDLSWFTFISASIHRGKRLITDKVYRTILGLCAIFLLGIGVMFLLDSAPCLFSQL